MTTEQNVGNGRWYILLPSGIPLTGFNSQQEADDFNVRFKKNGTVRPNFDPAPDPKANKDVSSGSEISNA